MREYEIERHKKRENLEGRGMQRERHSDNESEIDMDKESERGSAIAMENIYENAITQFIAIKVG